MRRPCLPAGVLVRFARAQGVCGVARRLCGELLDPEAPLVTLKLVGSQTMLWVCVLPAGKARATTICPLVRAGLQRAKGGTQKHSQQAIKTS